MQHNTTSEEDDLISYFVNAIKRMYWAEKQIAELLEYLRGEAFDNTLKNAIEIHEAQTRDHIRRLEQVLEELGQSDGDRICEALQGLVKDARLTLGDTVRKTRTRDTSIRASLLKVEHNEMATYAVLIQVAQELGMTRIEQILQQTLVEEKEMEEQLQHPQV